MMEHELSVDEGERGGVAKAPPQFLRFILSNNAQLIGCKIRKFYNQLVVYDMQCHKWSVTIG